VSELVFKIPLDWSAGLKAPVSSSNAFAKVDSLINTQKNVDLGKVGERLRFKTLKSLSSQPVIQLPESYIADTYGYAPFVAKKKKKKKKKKKRRG